MMKCPRCARYTLREACPQCGAATVRPGPARYSPEDAYGAYRRRLKKLARESSAPGVGGIR